MKQFQDIRPDQGNKKVAICHYKLKWIQSESIEYFIEDQAFSPWYDLLPYFPSPVNKLELADGRGGWGGAKWYDGEKTGPLKNHLILSEFIHGSRGCENDRLGVGIIVIEDGGGGREGGSI